MPTNSGTAHTLYDHQQNSTMTLTIAAYPALHAEARTLVPTDCAAFHLNRRPQTLRSWACHQDGPLQPIRINGRLCWRVSEIRGLVGQPPQAQGNAGSNVAHLTGGR